MKKRDGGCWRLIPYTFNIAGPGLSFAAPFFPGPGRVMKLKKMRVFLALELPAALREQLGELQGRLSFLGRGIKWVKEENMHLTLYFLGDLNTEKIQGLYSCLEDTPRLKSFKVDVSGLGISPG